MSVADFERRLAAELPTQAAGPDGGRGGGHADPDVRRHAGRSEHVDVVRAARATGIRTGLLSNSWGLDYDRGTAGTTSSTRW